VQAQRKLEYGTEAMHDYNGRALKRFKTSKGHTVPAAAASTGRVLVPTAASKIYKLVRHFFPKKYGSKGDKQCSVAD